jgi:hypothetical protein
MSGFHQLIQRIQERRSKNRFESEMDEEMKFHLDSMIQDNVRNGMSYAKARKDALVRFGSFDSLKDECRDSRWGRIPGEIKRDVLYGIRMMRKNPGLIAVAVIILALGIGANTAIVGFIDAVIFRPPAIPAPNRVLSGSTPWSLAD